MGTEKLFAEGDRWLKTANEDLATAQNISKPGLERIFMQFIDLKSQFEKIETSVRTRIDTVLEHGKFIMGP